MKIRKTLCAAFILGTLFGGQSLAAGTSVFQKQEGPWKASCFKDQGVEKPYCRIMIINVFAGSKKSSNFVQFGPAFDRGNAGFVFATYLGFAPESTVKVKIGENEAHVLQTQQSNHTIAPADMSKEILSQMNEGKSITVEFKLSTGLNKSLDFSLAGYKTLLPEVQKAMEVK